MRIAHTQLDKRPFDRRPLIHEIRSFQRMMTIRIRQNQQSDQRDWRDPIGPHLTSSSFSART
jgi:hypothetical protein